MDEILNLLEEYIQQTDKVIAYMKNLQNEDKIYYRRNQEILYIGIVNRTYSLWETFCKDLVFKYYELVKDRLLNEGSLVKKLKLNELPGYIVELGIIQDKYISYELKKDFITYTSKNIGYNELDNLFSRFDVSVAGLKVDKKIKEFIEKNSMYFGIEDFSKDYLKAAMRCLTDERNIVSHYSSIDRYQELAAIQIWAQLFQILATELSAIVCTNYINEVESRLAVVGNYVNYYKKRNILCLDIAEGITIDKKSMIIVKKNDDIECFLKPVSFQVNGQDKTSVESYDNAGIKVKCIFDQNKNINKNDEIFVINDVF